MASHRLWVLLAVSLLSGVLVALFMRPSAQVLPFLPLVMCVSLAIGLGISAVASRVARADVTNAENWARRLLFKESRPH